MLPSALLTASASQQAEFSELNLHGLLPCCVRFAPTSRPVNGNTRYRPARSLWPCGTYTRWTPSRGFTVSSSIPPLPRFSQRDNNVGPVKYFFEQTSPSTPKSGLPCSLLTSASTTTRFLQTPPHGDALALRYPSPPSGWDGTCTRQLPNMHGVQQKGPETFPGPFSVEPRRGGFS